MREVDVDTNVCWFYPLVNDYIAMGNNHLVDLECGRLCGCVFFGVFHQFLLISIKSYNQVQTPSQIASDRVKAWSKSLFSHVYNENHMFFLQPFNALGIYKITYAQS